MSVHDQAAEGRGQNFFQLDDSLRRLLVGRLLPQQWLRAQVLLERMGELAGGDIDRQAEYTDRYGRPTLATYDRQGQVVNAVTYNPLYEQSVRQVYGLGTVGCTYGPDPLPHSVHFALLYLLSQADPGLACPVTLTAATAFVLNRHGSAQQREKYLPGLTVRSPGTFLDGATWVTEKAAGSDAGAADTSAQPAPEEGPTLFRLSGEKWFASNADADLALVTARPTGAVAGTRGLGLYLVQRQLADGQLNRYRIRRLKDKLGTTGLATGEIELDGALAEEVSAPPEGFAHMLEALEYSRIANAVASAGIHRRAFLEASLYAAQRSAFGAALDRYPMMQETLLSMLAELEASLLLAFEAAAALDQVACHGKVEQIGWQRLLTALAKYRTGEDAVRNTSRAIEVLGGNGYVEDYVTARLYREAQVLPVWEGPANIQALEVLRLVGGRHQADVVLVSRLRRAAEVAEAHSSSRDLGRRLGAELVALERALQWLGHNPEQGFRHGRRLMDWMADLIEVGLLLERAAGELRQGDHRSLVLAWWLVAKGGSGLSRRGVGADLSWLSPVYRLLIDGAVVPAVPLPEFAQEVQV